MSQQAAFGQLLPEQILDAVESQGYLCDGHLLALNSYENRVYQIGIQDQPMLVGKFYRPGRWTDAAILEEHQFSIELADLEIPLVPPLINPLGETLHHFGRYRFALYPRRGGRAPDLEDADLLEQMGRFIARLHLVGETRRFVHRPQLSIEEFGQQAYRYLLQQGFIPADLQTAYSSLCEDLIKRIGVAWERAGKLRMIRLHGDCHPGNILWTDEGPHIVDLDDARSGPAIQDLWMFLSGERSHQQARLEDVLVGYTQFRDFDARELHLIEPLRTLRMMHYAAWLARRWDDPAFPRAFPYFNTERYWGEHILALREQAALLDEVPLIWD